MKVIDLLNKIANGEKVPNKVKTSDDDIFYYDETDDNDVTRYKNQNDIPIIDEYYLNDEVEVIEEDKEDNFTGMKYYQDGRIIYMIYAQPPFKCRDDVEIEEDKKIEKLGYSELMVCPDLDSLKEHVNERYEEVRTKINKIIDILDKEK